MNFNKIKEAGPNEISSSIVRNVTVPLIFIFFISLASEVFTALGKLLNCAVFEK
jgi:hypothetical protein